MCLFFCFYLILASGKVCRLSKDGCISDFYMSMHSNLHLRKDTSGFRADDTQLFLDFRFKNVLLDSSPSLHLNILCSSPTHPFCKHGAFQQLWPLPSIAKFQHTMTMYALYFSIDVTLQYVNQIVCFSVM